MPLISKLKTQPGQRLHRASNQSFLASILSSRFGPSPIPSSNPDSVTQNTPNAINVA